MFLTSCSLAPMYLLSSSGPLKLKKKMSVKGALYNLKKNCLLYISRPVIWGEWFMGLAPTHNSEILGEHFSTCSWKIWCLCTSICFDIVHLKFLRFTYIWTGKFIESFWPLTCCFLFLAKPVPWFWNGFNSFSPIDVIWHQRYWISLNQNWLR